MRRGGNPHLARQHRTQLLQSVAISPGTGKSRAAAAIAGLYRDLGVLRYGNLIEIPALDLPDPTARDTAAQVTEAVKVTGDLVMITGAHAWHDLPGHGQHLLRCLYQILTEPRKYHGDELAIILAGQAGPLRDMLHAAPALATICAPDSPDCMPSAAPTRDQYPGQYL